MERRKNHHHLEPITLAIYTLLSMVFAVGVIVCAALVMQADILAWNPTMLVSLFFAITGGFTGAFLLLR